MPVVNCVRDELFQKLGENFGAKPGKDSKEGNQTLNSCILGFADASSADEAFDQLCFEYGIELDDVVCTVMSRLRLVP